MSLCIHWVGNAMYDFTIVVLALHAKLVVVYSKIFIQGHFHEHTRSDRDEFVTINTNWINDLDAEDNTKQNYRFQFKKCTLRACQDLNAGYDYGSIMHYGSRTCIRLRNGQYSCECLSLIHFLGPDKITC